MELIMNNLTEVVTIGTAVVTIASVIANWTATDLDNKAVGWFSKLVNLLALNVKNVKK